ncbi:hypothetical protein L228DRAFT_239412 [Xylona heveae TC161]|uniref:Uncharacterized protein n=1 Tax=Xylona heveae (strain CBS 132557 / TC161) TaxID=1328760 RepID=A0A165GPV8_XYLHT|nr:hypothetical protein L228DRAFT_239412 [Xylona heveae TC161]KZF22448.1 hypothetical protein L228DRAFT_239412 [Xylona heveae TC161]
MSLERLAVDRQADDHKFLSKQSWRTKLHSKDDTSASKTAKKDQERAQEVADFLQPSIAKARAISPRIDTLNAQRWPAAVDVSGHENDSTLSHGSGQRKLNARSGRNKINLVVRFTASNPEIIGEGGDDAELPPNAVSRRGKGSQSCQASTNQRSIADGTPAGLRHAPTSTPQDGKRTRQETVHAAPVPLRRAPTGFPLDLGDQQIDHPPLGSTHPSESASVGNDMKRQNEPKYMHPQPTRTQRPAIRTEFEAKEISRLSSPSRIPSSPYDVSPVSPLQSSETAFDLDRNSPSGAQLEDTTVSPLSTPELEQEQTRRGAIPARPDFCLPSQQQDLRVLEPGKAPQQSQSIQKIPSSPETRQVVSGINAAPPPAIAAGPKRSPNCGPVLEDFGRRVEYLFPLFNLSPNSHDRSLSDWLVASVWWLLQARTQLEETMRLAAQSSEGKAFEEPLRLRAEQSWINLAKCWWIVNTFIPVSLKETSHAKSPSRQGKDDFDNEFGGIRQQIFDHLGSLVTSAQRGNLLPSSSEATTLNQNMNIKIWLEYPPLPRLISGLLNHGSSSLLEMSKFLPLGDTDQTYVYGRMFVEVTLLPENGNESTRFICALSILRDKAEWQVKASICSQNRLVQICIQNNVNSGPTWDDVHWKVKAHSLLVRIAGGTQLVLCLTDKDFKSLWGIYHHAQSFEKGIQACHDEVKVLQTAVKSCQYSDSPQSQNFPSGVVPGCRLYVFEKLAPRPSSDAMQSYHGGGFRLLVVTSPESKAVFRLDVRLGHGELLEFGFLRGKCGEHILRLQGRRDDSKFVFLLAFEQPTVLSTLWSIIHGGAPRKGENMVISRIPLKGFSIHPCLDNDEGESPHIMAPMTLNLQQISIIDEEASYSRSNPSSPSSRKLRICANGEMGVFTDGLSLETGPGELKVRMNAQNRTEVELIRAAQEDGISMCIAENRAQTQDPSSLLNLQRMIKSSSTIRNYLFQSLEDTHNFLRALTGFSVLYDGIASTFAISRRRMVVPIYKRWAATGPRIQILRHEKIVQLVAFFEKFNYGSCMNFQLKGTDVFENFSKSGKFYLRIVDAKFALPKPVGGGDSGFVCLDLPDYPGEHDDITLAFDDEADRDNFQKALPAPVGKFSRIGSLRK